MPMIMTNNSHFSSEFDRWWLIRGQPVEPSNIRRNGESGVERVQTADGMLYIKRQHNHLFRSLRYPLGYPTAMREFYALQALASIGIACPVPVFAQAYRSGGQWKSVLVTRELQGFVDLASWYACGGRKRLGEAQHWQFLHKLGVFLGQLHRHRWQHTSLYPKHIFVTAGDSSNLPEIALIDLEKARRCLRAGRAARRDLAQLRRHSPMWDEHDWALLLKGHSVGF